MYSMCTFFKKEKKVPPIELHILLDHFKLTDSVFKNLKYFVYRIIKKSIKMVSEKSEIKVDLDWDHTNKIIRLTLVSKDYRKYFDKYLTKHDQLNAQIDKKFQKDFFEILCAFSIPKTQAIALIREYYYLNEDDLKKLTAPFKTTPKNALFVYRWLK